LIAKGPLRRPAKFSPELPQYFAPFLSSAHTFGTPHSALEHPHGASHVNCVAPGPIWTPLIPSTMPKEAVKKFGSNVPIGRPGQPKEVAPVYVMLASDEASYISGATVAVTGSKPII
jgi:enoyl-[acyl-carrier-protein] reductase (NADH)